MNTAWMEMHGEYPEEPEVSCYCCGEMQEHGECVNLGCKNCERAHCAECNKLTYVDELKQDPYPVPNWIVCPSCWKASKENMGGAICENPIHLAEGGDLMCPDCGEAV